MSGTMFLSREMRITVRDKSVSRRLTLHLVRTSLRALPGQVSGDQTRETKAAFRPGETSKP